MAGRAVSTVDGTTIPLSMITDVRLLPEECTGDSEHDIQNTWSVLVFTAFRQGSFFVFKAKGYDNKDRWFSFLDAVKGKNYEMAFARYTCIKQAVKDEMETTVFI